MDELIGRLVDAAGIDKATAEKVLAIILDFLNKEGPADTIKPLIDAMPGAAALIEAEQANAGGGFAMGGLMGAGSRMMAAGLGMGQIESVTRAFIAYAREKAGDDAVGAVVGAIPGLGQYI
ncbi:MAG TPA: DUF2267 domain-containing protein [Pseudolabrys sp.]|nr:DUF2267 domain-containing protein [Pseudolabrys sp.]